MSKLLQDIELFNQIEHHDAIYDANAKNLKAQSNINSKSESKAQSNINSKLESEEWNKIDKIIDKYEQSNINSKLESEEWKKVDRILDKYPEIQEIKTNALARNGLNENSPTKMIEEVFTFLRTQRLAIIGINAKLPIDTTQVTLDCSDIGALNIVHDLKKLNSMSDVEMLKEGKTNLENPGVIENILIEILFRIINRGRSTCKIL